MKKGTCHLLAINGSPRRRGNTETLLAAIGNGTSVAGADWEVIRVSDLDIHPCTGCGGCEKTGECVLEDDMTALYPKILAADRIILASPIYFYGITAQAKGFVDRCQALWSRRRLLERAGTWQDNPERKGYLVAVAATRGAKLFEGARLTAQYAFEAMGAAYGEELLVRGIDRKGEMLQDAAQLAEAEAFGRRIAV
ncbi:MAG: flavodoxin family protein [Thermodesulfobacteriota bacterium]